MALKPGGIVTDLGLQASCYTHIVIRINSINIILGDFVPDLKHVVAFLMSIFRLLGPIHDYVFRRVLELP
jgi:hypothetical protein